MPGKTEDLCTFIDPTFTVAIEANRIFPSANGVVPQHWVTRIGVAFSFGFKSAVGGTMAFVLLQCLWLSVIHQPLTIQRMHSYWISTFLLRPAIEIDAMYRIERQDQLYKTLPQALSFSPTIVIFSVLTLLLPLSGVFAPGSLTVTTSNSTDISSCKIPTGNLSTPNTLDYSSLYAIDFISAWTITPRAVALATQWFVEQRIPDLPQACGPNCRYKIQVPSFAFQCTPNFPSSLPYAQLGEQPFMTTLWNTTVDPKSMQVGMLHCTIVYGSQNRYSVSYDMASPNSLNQ
jgi:hypothetical protein